MWPPPPPLPPQKILFLPPSLSQLLAVFMITNLNNDEYLGVFPWNALSPRNDGSLTYFGLEQKVKVKYIPVFFIHSRVPCRFLLFYYPFTNFSMNLARMHTCSTNCLPDYRSFSCGATHSQIHAVLLWESVNFLPETPPVSPPMKW